MMKLKKSAKLDSATRLYHVNRPILGLTGGIASGKSSVSQILKAKGFLIIDADVLVKRAYTFSHIQSKIKELSPGSIDSNGQINFKHLREKFFSSPEIKEKVEKLIYAELKSLFLVEVEEQNQDFVIYDVPLLFERGLDQLVDFKVLVYAPELSQRQRLERRDGTSSKVIDQILKSQMPIEEKKTKSDFVIDNSGGEEELTDKVENFIGEFFQ